MNVVIVSKSGIDDSYYFRLRKRENCTDFESRENSNNLFENR